MLKDGKLGGSIYSHRDGQSSTSHNSSQKSYGIKVRIIVFIFIGIVWREEDFGHRKNGPQPV